MATLRELKGRIGSVASSEKITGAMKMISSAKMHKAELALRRLRPYRDTVRTIIANLLSADAPVQSVLTAERPVNRVAIVVLGSDEGLCGAYNVNTFKFLVERLNLLRATYGHRLPVDIYAIGKKMVKAVSKIADADTRIITDVPVGVKSEGDAVKTFVELLRDEFTSGRVDRVDVVYMNYLSAGRQRPRDDQFLPIRQESLTDGVKASARPYLFEPDARTIFDTALPMYLLADMQNAFAENRASEQAARVMAMQSSNDNAKKLLGQLQIEYNKLRQQSITSELLDIVGGQAHD